MIATYSLNIGNFLIIVTLYNVSLEHSPSSLKRSEFMVALPKKTAVSSNRAYCNFCPGYCCYRLPGSVLFVTATDINRIARHFDLSDGEVRNKFIEKRNTFKVKSDGSCIFLDDGKLSKRCSVHMARPQQCQDFPYDKLCPYLRREDLLETIFPKVEKSLRS